MATRDAVAILAGAVLIAGLIGNSRATPSQATATNPLSNDDGTGPGLAPLTSPGDREAATTLIGRLTVKPMGSKTGYERTRYGDNWSDEAGAVPYSHNGCRTRDDLLARDGRQLQRNGCTVTAMRLTDPYTGKTIDWTKNNADEVQVDHVVPLSYGWRMGAGRWPMSKRLNFANDPLNLLPVYGDANEAKDGSGPATWLPPQRTIRCAYVVRFAQVAVKYRLPITKADKATMLAQCR